MKNLLISTESIAREIRAKLHRKPLRISKEKLQKRAFYSFESLKRAYMVDARLHRIDCVRVSIKNCRFREWKRFSGAVTMMMMRGASGQVSISSVLWYTIRPFVFSFLLFFSFFLLKIAHADKQTDFDNLHPLKRFAFY